MNTTTSMNTTITISSTHPDDEGPTNQIVTLYVLFVLLLFVAACSCTSTPLLRRLFSHPPHGYFLVSDFSDATSESDSEDMASTSTLVENSPETSSGYDADDEASRRRLQLAEEGRLCGEEDFEADMRVDVELRGEMEMRLRI